MGGRIVLADGSFDSTSRCSLLSLWNNSDSLIQVWNQAKVVEEEWAKRTRECAITF